jgi:hypothetical protein
MRSQGSSAGSAGRIYGGGGGAFAGDNRIASFRGLNNMMGGFNRMTSKQNIKAAGDFDENEDSGSVCMGDVLMNSMGGEAFAMMANHDRNMQDSMKRGKGGDRGGDDGNCHAGIEHWNRHAGIEHGSGSIADAALLALERNALFDDTKRSEPYRAEALIKSDGDNSNK